MAISRDELSKLTKRTRDKEYRLRRNGASPAEVQDVSPRVEWNRVKRMGARQRAAYAKRLEAFNSRDNALAVLESGEVIDKKVLTRAEQARRKWNMLAERERKRITSLQADAEEKLKSRLYIVGRNVRGNVLGSITEIAPMEKPKTKRGALKRAERLEEMVNRTFAQRRTNQRKNMVEILHQLNQHDLAYMVSNMKSENFDVLSTLSGVWNLLDIWYVPKEERDRARPMGNEDIMAKSVRDLVYQAQTYGMTPEKAENRIRGYRRNEDKRIEDATRRATNRRQ